MADNSSEEKTLPASDKKLRDSRKKGKVSQSRDFVGAGALLAVTGYLFIVFPTVRDNIWQLVESVSRASGGFGSSELMPSISSEVHHASVVLLLFVAPLALIIAVTVIITGMIATLGPVFSFENVKFELDKINPAKGFERLFSLRSLVGFVQSLGKLIVLATALLLVVRMWVQSFFEIPACGKTCTVPVLMTALKPLVVTAIIAFLVVGFIDLLVQRRLFLRDMRMTKTEVKREQKDLEGDPLIKSERRRMGRRAVSGASTGLRRAAFVLAGEDKIVALRYDGVEVIVPVIAAKADGAKFEATLERARTLQIPIIENAELAGALFERQVGTRITREFYDPVIRILRDLGLLRV
jgi:type III secretion protein U